MVPLQDTGTQSRSSIVGCSQDTKVGANSDRLSVYTTVHPRTKQSCADCMSRLPISCHTRDNEYITSTLAMDIHSLSVTSKDIAKANHRDRVLAVVLQSIRPGNWPTSISEDFTPYYRRRMKLSYQDYCILWGQQVVVPSVLQSQLLQELYEDYLRV